MGNQQNLFDGFQVGLFDGKFSGAFDIDEDMATEISYDDVVTFVVTARVGGVSFKETKNGDMKRTNSFEVTNASALDRTMAEKVLNSIGVAVNGVNAGQTKLPDVGSITTTPDSSVADVPVGRALNDPALQSFLNS